MTFIFSNTVQLASATTSVMRGHGGHDRMVVGFTATCAILAYHH